MRSPMIGVCPLVDRERESYWMLPGYLLALEEVGAAPLMLPLTEDEALLDRLAETLDGFLFTGGQDVSPEVYGAAPLPCCSEVCPARDGMEAKLLERALARNKPVLGICRGLQFLNAALGGTLCQDLPTLRPSQVCHRQRPPYHLPAHSVTLVPGAPLAALLGRETLAVNSCHHQGIDRLSPRLLPMAEAADGLVEAVYLPERRFVWAVQWHPEFSYRHEESSRAIFRAFVGACKDVN